MREYECKYPLEVLNSHLYPNLRRDGRGIVISDNITSFRLEVLDSEKRVLDGVLREMESKAKEYCSNAELAFRDSSGNRWIFLLFNGESSKDELKQMQIAYEKIYDPAFMKWRTDYEKQIRALRTV